MSLQAVGTKVAAGKPKTGRMRSGSRGRVDGHQAPVTDECTFGKARLSRGNHVILAGTLSRTRTQDVGPQVLTGGQAPELSSVSRRGCKQPQKPKHPAARCASVLSKELHSVSASPQEAAPHTGLVQPSQQADSAQEPPARLREVREALCPGTASSRPRRCLRGCWLPFSATSLQTRRFGDSRKLPCFPALPHVIAPPPPPPLLQWPRDTHKGAHLPKPVGCLSPTPLGLTWRQC